MKKSKFLYCPWFLFMAVLCYLTSLLFGVGAWIVIGTPFWGYCMGGGSLLIVFHAVLPLLDQAEEIWDTSFALFMALLTLSVLGGFFVSLVPFFFFGKLGVVIGSVFSLVSVYVFLLGPLLESCGNVLLSTIKPEAAEKQTTPLVTDNLRRYSQEKKLIKEEILSKQEERKKILDGWVEKKKNREELPIE